MNIFKVIYGEKLVSGAKPDLLKSFSGWIAATVLAVTFFWLLIMIGRSLPRPQANILMFLSLLMVMLGLWKINDWMG